MNERCLSAERGAEGLRRYEYNIINVTTMLDTCRIV